MTDKKESSYERFMRLWVAEKKAQGYNLLPLSSWKIDDATNTDTVNKILAHHQEPGRSFAAVVELYKDGHGFDVYIAEGAISEES